MPEARRGLRPSKWGGPGVPEYFQALTAKVWLLAHWVTAVALGPYELEVRLLSKARAQRTASPYKVGQKNVPCWPRGSTRKLTLQKRWQGAEERRGTLWWIKTPGLCHSQEKNPNLCGTGKPNWGINVKSVSRPAKALRYPEQQMQSTVWGTSIAQGTGYSHGGGTSAKPISTWCGLSMNLEMTENQGGASPKMSSESKPKLHSKWPPYGIISRHS